MYYGDRKINFRQKLTWWVKYFTLRGKIVDINNFKTDILDDSIEESHIYFEYTMDGKGGLRNPREFSHEKWAQ